MDWSTWLDALPVSESSIEALVAEGYWAIALSDLMPWMLDHGAMVRIAKLKWVKTTAEGGGNVVVMTLDSQGFDELLDWMLEKKGECPKVYGPDDQPVTVPDCIPALKPTAFNLPDGLSSDEVVDDQLLQCIEEIFQDLRQSFGNHACLHRFDYGAFMDHLGDEVLFLTGQFVDLDNNEVYEFTMDGVNQRIRYQSIGTFVGITLTSAGNDPKQPRMQRSHGKGGNVSKR